MQKIFKQTKLILLFLSFLFISGVSILFLSSNSSLVRAESVESDLEVKVEEVIAMSLTNCDATNSSLVNVNITPSSAGTFKSNCQTVEIDTNHPGYSLTVKASSSNLLYQNPTTITPAPYIPSTSNTIISPNVLSNESWGFAVENRLSFYDSYTRDNASDVYAALPTSDTEVHSEEQWPLNETSHTFYYGAKLTPATMAGTYMTTVTYTAIGAEVQPAPLKFRQISSGAVHSCAIASDNNAYCWGSGIFGKLGNGSDSDSSIPVPVSRLAGGLEGLYIKQLSVGGGHSCAIASDNNVYCWGGGEGGKLGNGLSLDSSVPVPVSRLTGGLEDLFVRQISVGNSHTCVVASDDNAYCWGEGLSGKLGNGSLNNKNIPTPISKIPDGKGGYLTIIQISAGANNTCAIASDNNAYCWGSGDNGQLGNGSGSISYEPVPVSKLTGGLENLFVKQISVGHEFACVLASDNNAYCWGEGLFGKLGNDSSSISDVPVPVSKLAGGLENLYIKQLVVNFNHTCVIASDDNVYCWGYGVDGQLGNGFSLNSDIPVPVSKLEGGLSGLFAKQVSIGGGFSCALTSDNNAYCWGGNNLSQLGNSLVSSSTVPVKVTNPTE